MPYDCIHFEYPGTPEIARMAISRLAPDGQWMSPCGACLELYEHKWLPDGELNPHLGEWALRLKSDDRKDRSRCATMDALQLRGRFLPGEPRTVIFFLDSRDATWTLDKPEPMGDILRALYRAVHREVHWILGQRAAQAEAQVMTPEVTSEGDTDRLAEKQSGQSKSKRGPRRYSRAEKIAARQEWDALDRDLYPTTLEEWLEHKFGVSPARILNVPKSTFYGWPKS
jgi:hypothetical protein